MLRWATTLIYDPLPCCKVNGSQGVNVGVCRSLNRYALGMLFHLRLVYIQISEVE
jgi:hypothetical protein